MPTTTSTTRRRYSTTGGSPESITSTACPTTASSTRSATFSPARSARSLPSTLRPSRSPSARTSGRRVVRPRPQPAPGRCYAATIAYVNLVGGQDELVFDGMSLVVDHLGTVVARGPQFQEGLVYCDVDLEAVQQARRANGVPAAGAPLDDEIARPTIPVAARRRRRRDP